MMTCSRCGSTEHVQQTGWCQPCINESSQKLFKKKKEYIRAHKDKPCEDCGVSYPHYVMDFDHVIGTKAFNLSDGHLKSWKVLDDEIAKCDIVCSNCHRVRTYERGY